jgi:hypothetical protein
LLLLTSLGHENLRGREKSVNDTPHARQHLGSLRLIHVLGFAYQLTMMGKEMKRKISVVLGGREAQTHPSFSRREYNAEAISFEH